MQTQVPLEKRKHTKAKVAGAAALAVILALSSTFAWTSFSQLATNELHREANAGGRLHDDFSFTQDVKNKDIYVENFTSEGDGAPIFARVQLREYLEIGPRAGQPETADKNVTRFPESATLDNKEAWAVHYYGDVHSAYAQYFAWVQGGTTTFMPTFNKNKDSLEADINGSYHDEGGRYAKYTEYAEGQTIEGSAVYDADENDIDEGDAAVEGVNITTSPETHTAKATGDGTVMSMAEWKEAGGKLGPYWVYDTDGWAYWAQPVQPGEATGLLLNGVELKSSMGQSCHYGIHAIGEFVSEGEWKQASDAYYFDQAGTKDITADAFNLLNVASSAWKMQLRNGPTLMEANEAGDISASAVSIGGSNFYKIALQRSTARSAVASEDRVLILAAEPVADMSFGGYPDWGSSSLRAYLNGEYLESLDIELQSKTIVTDIAYEAYVGYGHVTYGESQDKIFLPSIGDFVGASIPPLHPEQGKPSDLGPYTAGASTIPPTELGPIWTRSASGGYLEIIAYNNGANENKDCTRGGVGVCPMMWVAI